MARTKRDSRWLREWPQASRMHDAKNPIFMYAPAQRRLRDIPSHKGVMEAPNSFAGIRFCFQLDPMDNLAPWKEGDKAVLYWHALTHGDYWISTALGEILRYTEERQKLWRLSGPHADYEVGQLFLELMDLLPETLEPVPPDIAAIVSDQAWLIRAVQFLHSVDDDENIWEAWSAGTQWWHRRGFDSPHLTNGPSFHFWRISEEVFIHWEATGDEHQGVWTLPEGQFSLPVEEFKNAVFAFFGELLAAMQERVDVIVKDGWQRTDCEVNLSNLVDSQHHFRAAVHRLKDGQSATDWDEVRSGLAQYCAAMESSGFSPRAS